MKRLFVGLLALVAVAAGLLLWLRGPIAQTSTAVLKAYPVYSFVRTRNETLLRAAHREVNASNLLIHRTDLSGPRDRSVTTPNNDTLYSFAFLDLAGGPVELTLPALPNRYHSVAVMDARTDTAFLLGTREGGNGGTVTIAHAAGETGCTAATEPARRCLVPTTQSWLLVRVLVDGKADLPAARAAQQGFVLQVPEASRRPAREAILLPVVPDPATLIDRVAPLLAENPHLADAPLAGNGQAPDTLAGNGQATDARLWEDLPLWRQWLWRAITPRVFARMEEGIAAGTTATGDGWSQSPPGIGTAQASDAVRAAVALAGLGALPKDEAVYWSATVDAGKAPLDGTNRYRLALPATIPARGFWSLSLYERLPDGRLFYAANAASRYAVSDRTPNLVRSADGSLALDISAEPPIDQGNWLPAPKGRFTLIFRAYLPEEPILNGSFRLPPVQRIP